MSDEYDIANDAAEEAFYDEMYAEFKREHAAEIADDITTGEVVGAALAAHKEWWPLAEASLIKAASVWRKQNGPRLYSTQAAPLTATYRTFSFHPYGLPSCND
jgi:hypothetical protein